MKIVAPVSVVIPAHNALGTLKAAIDSLMAQTLGASEIIVVNDASTDETASVAGAFERVVLINLETRRGAAAARNAGVDIP